MDSEFELARQECARVAEARGIPTEKIVSDITELSEHGVRGRRAGVALHDHYHPDARPKHVNVSGILSE